MPTVWSLLIPKIEIITKEMSKAKGASHLPLQFVVKSPPP
jgi:hypothetical protein